jgi:hypothetical protein
MRSISAPAVRCQAPQGCEHTARFVEETPHAGGVSFAYWCPAHAAQRERGVLPRDLSDVPGLNVELWPKR